MSYKDFFKGKRVAMIGCGEGGSMISDIKFLLRLKADVTLYELRSADRLGKIAKDLGTLMLSGGAAGRLSGCHFNMAVETKKLSQKLTEVELIILSPDIPRNSLFLKAATEAGIQIEYPDVLFFKLIPPVMIIGIVGSVGKTAVAEMTYDMLSRSFGASDEASGGSGSADDSDLEDDFSENGSQAPGLFLIDAETRGPLSNLRKIKKNDIVIIRMVEALMNEYKTARVSPHIAVVTYLDPNRKSDMTRLFGILQLQTYNTYIVASDKTVDMIKERGGFQPHSKIIRTRPSIVPSEWGINFPGPHMRDNAALALEVALIFKTSRETIRESLESGYSAKGRFELIKKGLGKSLVKQEKKAENKTAKKGSKDEADVVEIPPQSLPHTILDDVQFYNDTASIRPEATIAALRALGQGKSVILIFGGGYTGVSYEELFTQIPKYVSNLIVLPGSGTLVERSRFSNLEDIEKIKVWPAVTVEHAVLIAKKLARRGDRILFSPACEATGIFYSRNERGETFLKALKLNPGEDLTSAITSTMATLVTLTERPSRS